MHRVVDREKVGLVFGRQQKMNLNIVKICEKTI